MSEDIGLKGDQVLKCPMAFGPKVPISEMRNEDIMSEKNERCAREIEALLKEHDLHIDGGELRDILAEELGKGGDATCPTQDNTIVAKNTVGAPMEHAAHNAAVGSDVASTVRPADATIFDPLLLDQITQPTAKLIREYFAAIEMENDVPKSLEAIINEALQEAVRREHTRGLEQKWTLIGDLKTALKNARDKHYRDYREYVGLVGQNESLRRQVDELQRQLTECGHGGMI